LFFLLILISVRRSIRQGVMNGNFCCWRESFESLQNARNAPTFKSTLLLLDRAGYVRASAVPSAAKRCSTYKKRHSAASAAPG